MPRVKTPTSTLMQRTTELLKERRVSLPQIQMDTGLPYYWLRKFADRAIKDPSVNRVQALFEYLTGRRLDVESPPSAS